MTDLKWSKNLSRTDAQQPTKGRLVPYLRLTSGDLKTEDFQTWFRDTFFNGESWTDSTFGKEDVEEAKVTMDVTIDGKNLGLKEFAVTHGSDRMDSHNTPNTWLHWPSDIETILQNHDFTDQPVTMTRQSDGKYRLEI